MRHEIINLSTMDGVTRLTARLANGEFFSHGIKHPPEKTEAAQNRLRAFAQRVSNDMAHNHFLKFAEWERYEAQRQARRDGV